MLPLNDIIRKCAMIEASDVHLVVGAPVKCRVNGIIRSYDDSGYILTPDDCATVARDLAGEYLSPVEKTGELDLSHTFEGNIRTRINIFRQQGYFSIAIRIFRGYIATPKELNLPPVTQTFADYKNGLVLFAGEAGCGKSTSAAAVIDQINKKHTYHIITLEEPIEYLYTPDKCVINQREVGRDTAGYSEGLRSVLREDPDVILIGEMRDMETIAAALTAAETGALVFSTLHTRSAADTVDRIVNMFPEDKQRQVRSQLAANLRAVVTQSLLPKLREEKRIAACEVMVVNSAISNLIREGKTSQIDSFIGISVQEGGLTLESALFKLVRDGEISRETAANASRRPESFGRF